MKTTALAIFCLLTISFHLKADPSFSPMIKKDVKPLYPKSSLFGQSSGVVEVVHMVDDQGNVFNPIVFSSTHPLLEENAIKAVLKTQYEPFPQELNNKVARVWRSIYFEAPSILYSEAPVFNKKQKKIALLLSAKSPNQKRIRRSLDRALENLQLGNNSIEAIVGLGLVTQQLLEFDYERLFGSTDSQIKALERAAAYYYIVRDAEEFEEAHRSIIGDALSKLFVLYLQRQRFGDALRAYDNLQELGLDTAYFDDAVERIGLFSSGAQSLRYEIEFDGDGMLVHTPIMPKVKFGNKEKDASSGEIFCDQHFEAFEGQTFLELDSGWGKCLLRLKGEPNSELTLTEVGQ